MYSQPLPQPIQCPFCDAGLGVTQGHQFGFMNCPACSGKFGVERRGDGKLEVWIPARLLIPPPVVDLPDDGIDPQTKRFSLLELE